MGEGTMAIQATADRVTLDAAGVVFPGGVPLEAGDAVVGAIGMSGGTVAQDQQVAGAAAFSGGVR